MLCVTGTKGRSGRPANTSHEEIARLAGQLFAEKGYSATSITDIATAAGIGRRTFFAYFASKSDAFWWVEENDLLDVERQLAQAPIDHRHPLQQVIDIAMAAPSWMNSTKETSRTRYLMIEQNPELEIGSQRLLRRWSRLIENHIRERLGVTTSDLLPEVIAAALLGVAQTLTIRWTFGDDDRPLRQLVNENIATVRRVFEETVAADLLR